MHTHPGSRSGLTALRVLREEGADLARVVLGHSGDTADVDYLTELADAGCLLGMDRFGLDILLPFEQRVGHGRRAVRARLRRAAWCCPTTPPATSTGSAPSRSPRFAPAWHYQHLFDDVLPALRERGVTETQLETMLVDNPRRYFSGPAPQGS